MRWVNATHLSVWGGSRDGQQSMPELLSRLIFAAKGPVAFFRFPSDESVQHPGWDGTCTVTTGDQFVPAGTSGWEIGVQRRGIRGKADYEYANRAADPLELRPAETTFVFATPQRFSNKEGWAAEKRAERLWHDVRVIDADDLVHWLERYPAVAQWLAVKIGRRPQGLRNLEQAWTEWAFATQTPLTPDVILADRDADASAIAKWLKETPSLLSAQAESPEEAIAFLYAAISPLPPRYRLYYWSRCVIAADNNTARQLVGIGSSLVIGLTDPEPGLAHRLAQDGHHVYAAYGPDATATIGMRQLARPWRHNLKMALQQAGLSEESSHRLARASGRSITALRRLMPAAPNFQPKWLATAPTELLAAMLAGSWVETSAMDRKVLAALAGRSYEQVEAALAPLAAVVGGPLVRSGSAWKVVSLRDLWGLLASRLSNGQLDRFEAAFRQVLGAINPRFDIDPRETFFEREGQFGEEASPELRRGLIDAMIAIGVYPDATRGAIDIAGRADRAVRKLLGGADARLWWSLCRDFKRLAEASPAAFLEAVEVGLDGNNPPIMSLFRTDDGFLMRTEYLSELLWALEMLARSPDYLMRAALLLAHLDQVDPGGTWGNRPAASLRQIFVPWCPQTYATPRQRLKVIDAITRRYPAIGWKLLVALAPRSYDASELSPLPDWRDFTPDEPEAITLPAVGRAAREIGARLLDQVGSDGARWKNILELWASFDPTWRSQSVKRLAVFANGLNSSAEIEEIRDELRNLLQKHRNFAGAQWAIPERDLEPLDAIFRSLHPTGPEDRHRWLFNPNPSFLRPNLSWEETQARLEAQQATAAGELLGALSPEGLVDFARTISNQYALGRAIMKVGKYEEAKRRVIEIGLLADDEAAADLATGMLFAVAHPLGYEQIDRWWERAVAEGWGDRAELRIVGVLPATPATWDRVAARSPSLHRDYWSKVNHWATPKEAPIDRVVMELISAGRAYDAVELLGQHVARAPAGDLIVRALHAALKDATISAPSNAAMFSHHLGLLLDRIEADPSVDEDEVVALEWSYFQVLRYSPRPPRALQRALARNPDFFALLVKTVWLPDDGTPRPDDPQGTQAMVAQAYNVLDDWTRVPGSDDNGEIDGAALEAWVKRARKLCAEAGRSEIGDRKIGEILAASQRKADEPWPPEPVRQIVEMVRSRPLERGLELGVYNRRGVTVRLPFDGGDQERDLGSRFRRDAEALRFDEWDRTVACLERIAEAYEQDARRADQDAEQRDWH